ncbi:MAG: helix-turn-helix transcriptional regulator [Burkholderiaceae bacterium]
MHTSANFSSVKFLIGDPARTTMLAALFDGRALPAGELAYAARVTTRTANSHLAEMLADGLISIETEGRHRYYRLAGPDVVHAIERLAAVQPGTTVRRKELDPKAKELRFSRCCYGHLAGQVGIAIAGRLQAQGYIQTTPDRQFKVTASGTAWFSTIGIDVQTIKPSHNGLARQCLDWTERSYHLAGPLGTQLLRTLCAAGWLQRAKDSRAVQVTPKGWAELKHRLNLDKIPR